MVFEDIFEELKPIASQQQVILRLVGDPEIEIMGDPVLIHRAFSNLIENGIHYNNPGGFVEISLNRVGTMVVIEIVDNGVGISEDQQKHIFERFYRVGDQKARFSEGKGLGLAITAHILNLHGGKISVKSVLVKGSTFTITFQNSNCPALQLFPS
ncbi:Alkaline phosphatase synthesis sensor protein PhoR [bioreactor metagenome]|uniref:histidine kinase n=1 Tax=bioreactor metagenome TaxID=1076179 RepID=A0A645J5X2_9ZZZZ